MMALNPNSKPSTRFSQNHTLKQLGIILYRKKLLITSKLGSKWLEAFGTLRR